MRELPVTRAPIVRLTIWLAPWLAVLAVASTLAYAADVSLVARWSNAPLPSPAQPAQRSSPSWVRIDVHTEDGMTYRVMCFARPEVFSGDVVSMDVRELDANVAAACDQLVPG